jgi:hypothetical protein
MLEGRSLFPISSQTARKTASGGKSDLKLVAFK